jgi:GAF domain-containing protein
VRSAFRLVFVAVTAALAIGITCPDVVLPWHPFGTFGFEANVDARITHIFPGLPADRADLRVGDTIVTANSPSAARSVFASYGVAIPGATASYLVRSPDGDVRMVRLTAVAFPRTLVDNVTDIIFILSYVAFIAIAAVLLLMRPSLSTWAFYLYAAGQISYSTVVYAYFPPALFTSAIIYGGVANTVASLALVLFAISFPDNAIRAWRRAVFIAAACCTAPVLTLTLIRGVLSSNIQVPAPHAGLQAAISDIGNLYAALMIVVAISAFAVSYATAAPSARARLRWIILGGIVGNGGITTITLMQTLPAIAFSPPPWAFNVLSSLDIFFPIAVAYALLKQHLIEVRFFLSRALVYSLVTSVAVVALAVVEFGISQTLEATKIGIIAEVCGAVAIGLGISRLHGAIDAFVERFVFRTVYEAERHLQHIGDALMFASSTQAIDGMLALESKAALHLGAVSVVREFDPDEPLPLRLISGREAVDHGSLLAVPLLIRHHLFGYVLYAHHTNGAAIDPKERTILERLTARAAHAYDHVASEERLAENERLRLENGVLRSLISTF